MLAEFEWVIQHALEQALEDHSKSGAVVRPQRARSSRPQVLPVPNNPVATLPNNPVAASVANTKAGEMPPAAPQENPTSTTC